MYRTLCSFQKRWVLFFDGSSKSSTTLHKQPSTYFLELIIQFQYHWYGSFEKFSPSLFILSCALTFSVSFFLFICQIYFFFSFRLFTQHARPGKSPIHDSAVHYESSSALAGFVRARALVRSTTNAQCQKLSTGFCFYCTSVNEWYDGVQVGPI